MAQLMLYRIFFVSNDELAIDIDADDPDEAIEEFWSNMVIFNPMFVRSGEPEILDVGRIE